LRFVVPFCYLLFVFVHILYLHFPPSGLSVAAHSSI
jgi:hypothetical protein